MPTVIGIVFFILATLCFFKRREWLLGLLLFAALFQASSAINFGSVGIQPYYMVACFFILAGIMKRGFWKKAMDLKGTRLMIAFGCIGVISAFLYPFLFAGTPVFSIKDIADALSSARIPLRFGMSNIAQATYLTINILVVVAAVSAAKIESSHRFYDLAFYALVTLVFVQFLCLVVGVSFPYSLIQNNPGYAMADVNGGDMSTRVVGTFSEPSAAGTMLVIFYAGYFYVFFSRKGSILKVALAAVSIGLVRSSSALAAMLVVTVLILFTHPVIRLPWFIRPWRLAKLALVLGVAFLIVLSPARDALEKYTTGKTETASYVERTTSDLFALRVAADTHWIGVGLGSIRPSSLLTSLLSTVGILGMVVFLCMYFQLGRNAVNNQKWLRWSLVALLFNLSIAGPDITSPVLWLMLAFAVTTTRQRDRMPGSHTDGELNSVATRTCLT